MIEDIIITIMGIIMGTMLLTMIPAAIAVFIRRRQVVVGVVGIAVLIVVAIVVVRGSRRLSREVVGCILEEDLIAVVVVVTVNQLANHVLQVFMTAYVETVKNVG